MENKEFIKFIENELDKTLEKSNGVALELMMVTDKLRELGLYNAEEKESIEYIRAKSMGVYDYCQELCRKIIKFKKENEKNE